MEVDEEEYDIPDEIESVIGRFHYNTFISMIGIFTKHIYVSPKYFIIS